MSSTKATKTQRTSPPKASHRNVSTSCCPRLNQKTARINLCEQARADTYHLMCDHARQHGANAVISMRYDATELMAGLSEVLCYGTAVVVEAEA